jgi:putative ABC transport system substrate-binding protein
MRRIAVLSVLWLSGAVLASAQERPVKVPVIGWLSPATTESYGRPGGGNPGLELLRTSLARHGLIDGRNIRVEMRLAEGKLDRLPALADALVREGATVILAYGEPAGRAAQAATKTLPIVCVADDLVDSGLAADLAKPVRNMTGISILATELDVKKLELLRELLPRAKRVGVLNDPATSGPQRSRGMAEAARRLGITLQTVDVRGANDLEPAFRALHVGGAEGVNIVSSAMLTSFRRRLGELSLAAKIPAICQWGNMVEAGCLASYGITITELYELSADQIARLLKGTKPGELPIEQPKKFELNINGKTAKALGLSIPQSVLLRADRVLQ